MHRKTGKLPIHLNEDQVVLTEAERIALKILRPRAGLAFGSKEVEQAADRHAPTIRKFSWQ